MRLNSTATHVFKTKKFQTHEIFSNDSLFVGNVQIWGSEIAAAARNSEITDKPNQIKTESFRNEIRVDFHVPMWM